MTRYILTYSVNLAFGMAAANNRLSKELSNMQKSPPPGILAGPVNDDLYHWEAVIQGPTGSPYQGGKFKLDIKIPPTYPHKAPEVVFVTKIYHPNVDDKGKACLPILSKDWAPSITLDKILVTIAALLAKPDPDHAQQVEMGLQFREDRPKFDATAKEWVKLYASGR
jgi:ubiquitin-conjugating enzyme E2 D/E